MKSTASILKSALHTKLSLELTYRLPSATAEIASAPEDKYSYDFGQDTHSALPGSQALQYAL